MEFKKTPVNMQPEIRKRVTDGDITIPITLNFTNVTAQADGSKVVKAGSPISAAGVVVNGVTTYALSTDTTVQSGKTYYTRSGSEGSYVYAAVDNPTGNPSTSNYYEATTDAAAVGILLTDVYDSRPIGTIIKHGCVNTAVANSNSGLTISDTVKTALSLIIFE